jgi:hypothetical protein
MWIMLIKKLPTKPSPPKLSIFWSDEWMNEEIVVSQFKRMYGTWRRDGLKEIDPNFFLDEDGNRLNDTLLQAKMIAWMQVKESDRLYYEGFGADANWAKARSIFYKGERIRVFPEEFSILTHENMSLYIGMTGDAPSHELVPDTVSSQKVVHEALEGSLKEVYDAALVDGCTHAQAVAMALGIGFDDPAGESGLASFPPMGWYRCIPEYALYYAYEEELSED